MIKLKSLLKESWWDDLSDKAQQAYIEKHGSAPNVAGDDEKKDKPKKKPLPGIGAPPHPDSPSQKGATTKGPKSKAGALGSNPTREREIIAAVQNLIHDDRDVDLCRECYLPMSKSSGENKGIPR